MAKKVFELAKELDINSLELVEKLKGMGILVRNHMSSLSDEDLCKFETLSKPAEDKKTTKKKTTKKKAAKKKATKKTTKKASSAEKTKAVKKVSASSTSEEVSEGDPKKPTVRKKAVIRKKAKSVSSQVDETVAIEEKLELEEPRVTASESTQSLGSEVETEKIDNSVVEATEPESTNDSSVQNSTKSFGLNIVSRPVVEPEVSEVITEEVVEAKEGKAEVKEVVAEKPRVGGLRVVSMPSKSDLEKQAKEKEEQQQNANSENKEDSDENKADEKTGTFKKRMGGLASMMSGKKPVVNRSLKLNEQRADNELKSYSTLSSLGKPIYTSVRKKKTYSGPSASTEITEKKTSKRVIYLHDGCTAELLAKKLSQKFKNMADACLEMNLLVKPSDFIGMYLATEIASLYEYRVENKAFNEDEVLGKESLSSEEREKLPLRNPIITIMGHVDHGKTTLLDYIRKAKVAQGEAGGITQHIGAYSVAVKNSTLTFLDTPGHAAFASMRQRGADVTDIVILVVAADDGVMPQTKESIRFCQQSGKPIIIAVNKMDKEAAKPDRVKQELTEFELTPEEWGGDTQFCHISALNGDGVDELLESVALQAEMMELRATPMGIAEGVVIESKVEQGRGPVATVLVQSGTLKKGDSLVVGESFGRSRSLMSSFGEDLKSAGPSMPVQILGLDTPPIPGDILNVVKNEREAKKIVSNRVNERKKLESAPVKKKVSLEDFFGTNASEVGEVKALNLIVRADVQGSYEAIKQSLLNLTNSEVEIKVIGGGVGAINDSDVNLAIEAGAFILGFNMRPINTARRLAENRGVDVKTYSIIYEVINDVKLAMEGLLEPEFEEEFIGRAEVRDIFSVPKVGVIAGSYVVDGKISAGCSIRLLRSGKIVFDGKMSSLKRFKDDVKEVKYGLECGIGLESFNDIKDGDIFEAYMTVEKKRTLEDVEKKDEQASSLEATL
jgi:translation initiation factor IF-2